MKKYIYFYLLLVALCLSFFACVRHDDEYSQQTTPENSFSIEEAMAFFEKDIADGIQTRTDAEKRNSKALYPGEFTPTWVKAAASTSDKASSIDIPITPQYRFYAIRTTATNSGEISAYRVVITQKLTIVKSKKTGKIAQYILTLIPEKPTIIGTKVIYLTNS